MTEITMHTSGITEHVKNGAKLHRAFGGKFELRTSSGVFSVSPQTVDHLIDQGQIVDNGDGFYRVA